MTQLAIIHAGPAAPELKKLLRALDSVGSREHFFMEDLISTLRYAESFETDLDDLLNELVQTNGYFQYCVSHGDPEMFRKYETRFMDHVSTASQQVAKYLHTTLVNQSRYDADGKFPYEFHNFDGRLICLRRL